MPIGPSTTTAPYVLASEPNVTITSIVTVGDVIGTKPDGVTPYRFVGIPDGLGAFDNLDGTFTLLTNHEIVGKTFNLSGIQVGAGDGIAREHGETGSFVSRLVIDKSTLAVVSAEDAIKQVRLWDRFDTDSDGDANTDWLAAAPFSISRLCSADLAPVSAYHWIDTQGTVATSDDIEYGTTDRIFLTGEEFSPSRDNPATPGVNEEILGGREFAFVATGADAGTAFELAHMGYFAWENTISSPLAQKKTISIGLDDGLGGQLYVYVGEKQTTGNAVEKAGLTNMLTYVIQAENLNNVTANNNESDATAASGRFNMVAEGDISLLTGIQLDDLSESKGGTSFLRPEDGQFDTLNPNVFWFLTTASFSGQSRLYKLTFDDITNPEAGGTIEAVLSSSDLPLNGTIGPRMMDNMTVNSNGKILIQEDPGNQAHLARIYEYDPVTDTVVELAKHDPALFTTGLAGFITQDEEASGIIEVTDILGTVGGKSYLMADQIHSSLRITDPELVEKGQIQLITVSDVVNGGNGSDVVNGDGRANALTGGNGNDTMNGGSGNDTLNGGNNNDVIVGGNGADVIEGARGDDNLTGGAGADVFDFTRVIVKAGGVGVATGRDTITDFTRGEDVLVFTTGDFIRAQRVGDFDSDGVADDYRLTISNGANITLLNLTTITTADYTYEM